jgi:four helix bundle protein
MRTHKDLDVWKLSVSFVVEIYKTTAFFPKNEIFGIVAQMRRAAVSIPSNIAEGAARNHQNEFKQFLYIALGSAAELNTQIIVSQNLDYIQRNKSDELIEKLDVISKMIQGLIKSVTNK